jgi:hypothetical protein
MDILWWIAGFMIGLYVWAAFWGTLLATIPANLKAKRLGFIKEINRLKISGQLLFSGLVILAMFVFAKPMFYGSVIAAIIMLFNVSKLRVEAIENIYRDHRSLDDETTNESDDYIETYLLEAAYLATKEGKISASLLQGKLRVGYARAMLIIDELERCGLIKRDTEKGIYKVMSKSISPKLKEKLLSHGAYDSRKPIDDIK